MTKQSSRSLSMQLLVSFSLLALCFVAPRWANVAEAKPLDAAEIEKLRILDDNHAPLEVDVALHAGNTRFVADLIRTVDKINKSEKLGRKGKEFKVRAFATSEEAAARVKALLPERIANKRFEYTVPDPASGIDPNDMWMRDWGATGVVKVKGEAKPRLMIFDSGRGRGLAGMPAAMAKNWNATCVKNPSQREACGDYGGNILPTPENVLVVGNTSTTALRNFLEDKGYKGRMAVVDTSWLTVGHSDEYISKIPDAKGPTGYSFVKADPRLGLTLARDATPKQLKAIKDPTYREAMTRVHDYLNPPAGAQASSNGMRENIVDYLSHLNAKGNPTRAARTIYRKMMAQAEASPQRDSADRETEDFILNNLRLGKKIDRNLANACGVVTRARETPRGTTHVVTSYPQLFAERGGGTNDSFNPDAVNQTVLLNHTVTPDPKIPFFRKYIREAAKQRGVTVHFRDDTPYHRCLGEIHCGTNVVRDPNRLTVAPKYSSKRSSTSGLSAE